MDRPHRSVHEQASTYPGNVLIKLADSRTASRNLDFDSSGTMNVSINTFCMVPLNFGQSSRIGRRFVITFHILDTYMGGPETDWIQAYASAAGRKAAEMAEQSAKLAAQRIPDAEASRPLVGYAGNYRDRWYGDVDVLLTDGKLRIGFTKSPRLAGSLSPWGKDTFLVSLGRSDTECGRADRLRRGS